MKETIRKMHTKNVNTDHELAPIVLFVKDLLRDEVELARSSEARMILEALKIGVTFSLNPRRSELWRFVQSHDSMKSFVLPCVIVGLIRNKRSLNFLLDHHPHSRWRNLIIEDLLQDTASLSVPRRHSGDH
jgi:hypothetical protein